MFARLLLLAAVLLLPGALRAELVLQPTGRPDEVRAVFSGEISHADVASARELGVLLKSGKRKLAGQAVAFSSKGGDFDASLVLGRLLRELRVFTVVAKNDQCLSSCVFAFMGGERRLVEGRLGIHRPWFPFVNDLPDRQARYRIVQKLLRAYIEEMDFPDSLYETVMSVPPESMHFLEPAELKRFYLAGISPSSEDLADAAEARRLNLDMYQYLNLKRKGGATAPFSRCSDAASLNVACSSAIEPSR